MQVVFSCPECEHVVSAELTGEPGQELRCGACGRHSQTPDGAIEGGQIRRCVVCPSSDLFVRKDFSQRVGVGIVVAGAVLSSLTWYYHQIMATYAILFATALIDVVLYVTVGNVLQCYRCQAQYRGLPDLEGHGAFSLETHERHRQQVARLEAATRK